MARFWPFSKPTSSPPPSAQAADVTRRLTRLRLRHTTSEDILVAQEGAASYTGNPYPDYPSAVDALVEKYNNEAAWGNFYIRGLVDCRAAFAIGEGFKPYAKADGATRELELARRFTEANNLDEEAPQEWSKLAEVEGKALIYLFPDIPNQIIRARIVPWNQFRYSVTADPADYKRFIRAEYYSTNGQKITYTEDRMVFARFTGALRTNADCSPKLSSVLRLCEDLDKALWDYRKINHLFASPTPWIETEDRQTALDILEDLNTVNWTLGKAGAGAGKFSLVVADADGLSTIVNEIASLVKSISGASGVPVHYLGWPELMSNRSTAENLMEMVSAATEDVHRLWIGTAETLYERMFALHNRVFNQDYRTDAVGVQVPIISAQRLTQLVEIWTKLADARVVSRRTLMQMIPSIDADVEERLVAADAEAEIARAARLARAQASANPQTAAGTAGTSGG